MRPHDLWRLIWIHFFCLGHQGSSKCNASRQRVILWADDYGNSGKYRIQWQKSNIIFFWKIRGSSWWLLVCLSVCRYVCWSAKRCRSKGLRWNFILMITFTLRPPSTTIVPYANSLDPDETPSDSASHSDPSCLTLIQHFCNIEALWKLKQTRNLADKNLFGRLRVRLQPVLIGHWSHKGGSHLREVL